MVSVCLPVRAVCVSEKFDGDRHIGGGGGMPQRGSWIGTRFVRGSALKYDAGEGGGNSYAITITVTPRLPPVDAA